METYMELRQTGLPTRLVICGCSPTVRIQERDVEVIPFLNKNNAEDQKKLADIFMQTDFLILPTRADASPIVIAEANAFGVPVLATRVGGIPDLVQEGENGFLFALEAKGPDYARMILKVFTNEPCYRHLRDKAREHYEKRLNWDNSGLAMRKVFAEVLGVRTSEAEKTITPESPAR